jgi:hypothetical protein
MPHGQRVREQPSGRVGTVAGYTQSETGEWQWAVAMDDDHRVWMVSERDLHALP